MARLTVTLASVAEADILAQQFAENDIDAEIFRLADGRARVRHAGSPSEEQFALADLAALRGPAATRVLYGFDA